MSEPWCGNCAPDTPGAHIRLDAKGKCVDCGQQVFPCAITMRELRRIDCLEELETKFEEFVTGLEVSESVKAIIKVKFMEATKWIEQHAVRNGFLL